MTKPRPRARKRGRPRDEQRRAQRREEILDVSARVFAERGFPGTDLQEVADAVGIGKGTVYRYFASKHDLFLATADRAMRELLESLRTAAGEAADPLEQFARAIRSYLAFFDRHPEMIELLMQERAEFRDRKHPTYFQHFEANAKRWRGFFRDLMRIGRVRKMRAAHIIDTLSDLLYGTIFTNRFAGRKESFEAQSRRILDIALLGILTEGERNRYLEGRAM